MSGRFVPDDVPDPYVDLDMWPHSEAKAPMSKGKRMLLFAIGVAFGALLFLIGGISWQPSPPGCHGCAVLNANIHSPGCTEAVQGGWVCDGH